MVPTRKVLVISQELAHLKLKEHLSFSGSTSRAESGLDLFNLLVSRLEEAAQDVPDDALSRLETNCRQEKVHLLKCFEAGCQCQSRT